MTSVKVWGARLAGVLLAAVIPACGGTDNPNGIGVDNNVLWNSQSSAAAQPGGVADFWNTPGTGVAAVVTPDPEDVITYTSPVIYILGLMHPLQTQVTFQEAPNIVLNYQQASQLMIQYRVATYTTLLGNPNPLPAAATLANYEGCTECAVAHCKHYPVWHPMLPFPLTNVEGDAVGGRLTKSQINTANVVDYIYSGATQTSGSTVAQEWITALGTYSTATNPPTVGPLLDPEWTNLDVGFWELGGTVGTYYWELILSENPAPNVVLPALPNFALFP